MAAVARFFDREQALDAYSGASAFLCQYSSFDDSAGDGSTNRRRGMSTAPDAVIPARRAIALGDQKWIVGEATDDSFQGTIQRKNYNLKKVTHLVSILTPREACTGAAGTQVYVQLHYFKDTVNQLTDADYDTFWNVFSAVDEPLSRGAFLRDESGQLYRVRQSYSVAEGFLVSQTDQLDLDARQQAIFDTGVYDPVSDSFAAGTQTAWVVKMEPTKYFHFRLPAESPLRSGDLMVIIPAELAVQAGTVFHMDGVAWRVVINESFPTPDPVDSWYRYYFRPTDVHFCLARRA